MKTPTDKQSPANPDIPPAVRQEIAERVGEEILHRRFSPGAWAIALAAARSNHSEKTAEYARIRLAELLRKYRDSRAKAESFEIRRLKSGGGAKSVKEMLEQTAKLHALQNSTRPEASSIWLLSLLLGSAGSIGCGARVFGIADDPTRVPALALLCGITIVGAVLILRLALPRHWVRAGYNLGLGSATMVTCLLSLYLGTRLLASSPQQWQLIDNRIVAVQNNKAKTVADTTAPAHSADSTPNKTTASVGER